MGLDRGARAARRARRLPRLADGLSPPSPLEVDARRRDCEVDGAQGRRPPLSGRTLPAPAGEADDEAHAQGVAEAQGDRARSGAEGGHHRPARHARDASRLDRAGRRRASQRRRAHRCAGCEDACRAQGDRRAASRSVAVPARHRVRPEAKGRHEAEPRRDRRAADRTGEEAAGDGRGVGPERDRAGTGASGGDAAAGGAPCHDGAGARRRSRKAPSSPSIPRPGRRSREAARCS